MKRWLLLMTVLALAAGPGITSLGEETKKAEEKKEAEKTYFKTYPLQTSDIDLTQQVLKELLGDKRQVFYQKQQNQIIVSATAEEHKQIEAVLADINVPSPNVQLDIVTTLVGSSSDTRLGAKGGSGNVQVTKDGTKVHYKIKPEARAQSAGASSLTKQTLVVTSGKEASLTVAQEVPFYEYIIQKGKDWNLIEGVIEKDILTERTGAFLVARPQVIGTGPMINVTLIPEIRVLVGTKRQRIQFTRVQTTVTVRDGETITLGGVGEIGDFYDKFLVGLDEGGNRKSMSITLTPHIMKNFGVPPDRPK